jgi:broad specificity phosphatase PhoE
VDARLADWNLGSWAGRTLADVGAGDPDGARDWLGDPDAAPHGGESLTGLLNRVGAYLAEMATTPGRHIAVTHPAVVRAAVVTVVAAPAATFWRIDVSPLTRVRLSAHACRWNLRLP